ncbi:hypothetical protein [Paenibacillus borealis]|uniref:Uncharacterized protein n=1 Tax=Paenibacillus borealis TaxID=160799 RepID=A0A089MQC0_PAEBO|nr:hypothetical protein [Paenibacillus borealis]AIQ58699.1 hypothetical protein PBOR_18450 [Paenibacillus borealis]
MKLAKLLKLSITLLFVLMICSACQNNKEGETGEYISLNELTSLTEKGDSLDWSDLNKYSFEDTGSGLYIRSYPIEGGHQLVLTGRSLESPPDKMYIIDQSGKELDFNQDNLSEWYELK